MTNLTSWPKTENGEYILQSSKEAATLGHLIDIGSVVQGNIILFRVRALSQIMAEEIAEEPDYNKIIKLATKAQLYRECLEAVERINYDRYHP